MGFTKVKETQKKHKRNTEVTQKKIKRNFQSVGRKRIVGIEKSYIFSPRCGNSAVPCRCRTAVRLCYNRRKRVPARKILCNFVRPVLAAVIDENNLNRIFINALPFNRSKAPRQSAFRVIKRYYKRYHFLKAAHIFTSISLKQLYTDKSFFATSLVNKPIIFGQKFPWVIL